MRKQMCLGVMLSLVASSMLLAETFELGKIEVTSEKDISANPSVEVVTSETIKETDAKTVVDALQSTPGVYTDYMGARGESKVRVRRLSNRADLHRRYFHLRSVRPQYRFRTL